MSYRRRHRWFRRITLGLAFATAALVGNVSLATAKFEEGTGSRTKVESSVVRGEDVGSKVAPHGIASLSTDATRPDDRADRFSQADAVPQPEPAGDGWTVEWDNAAMVAIGGFVLVLGLGLALGYIRRPRLAGL